jgi:dethiobiotin synthetase
MTALFITGTGTDIGKTFVACLLIRQLRTAGRRVRALKPVATGYNAETAADSDAAQLLAALAEPATEPAIDAISPWRFAAPLSPDMAAAREGRVLDVAAIAGFCRGEDTPNTILLIEGIGGAMVPLVGRETVRDLIATIGCAALLVTGSYLGTLSHTLTAVEALAARHVPLAGVVVSESEHGPVPLAETVATLQRLVAPVPAIGLPRLRPGAIAPNLAAQLRL